MKRWPRYWSCVDELVGQYVQRITFAGVPLLEEDFGKPVITNATARAWRLMHDGLAPPKLGWGRLPASP